MLLLLVKEIMFEMNVMTSILCSSISQTALKNKKTFENYWKTSKQKNNIEAINAIYEIKNLSYLNLPTQVKY